MIVEQGLDALRGLPRGAVLSIGNFDGLHLGHQALLRRARSRAEARGAPLAVATFEPHPLTVLRPSLAPPRLTPLHTKAALLAAAGVERLVNLPPAQDVLDTTAEAFYALLRDAARVAELVEGRNFNFGKGRGGTVERLRDWCARDGIGLTVADEVEVRLTDLSLVAVSSSLVRWLLAKGRVRDVACCLGRPYALEGAVVPGEQRGRTIGFPTVNLACGDVLLPAEGVYAARCAVDGRPHAVALSIGTKPTFDGVGVTVEGHLLDFAGDLYGRTLVVEVLAWLRDQERYPSLATLVEQLRRDVAQTAQVVDSIARSRDDAR